MISVQKIKFSDLPKENSQIQSLISKELNSTSISLCSHIDMQRGRSVLLLQLPQDISEVKVNKGIKVKFEYQCSNIERNYKPSIMKQIRKIAFENLSHLNVAQNNINSLEPLIFLEAPNLKSLDISQNNIHSLKLLRKTAFSLSTLHIHGNPILELNYIQQIKFDKLADEITVQEFKTGPTFAEGVIVLVKIESLFLKEINLKKRINHSLIEQCLKARNEHKDRKIQILSPLY